MFSNTDSGDDSSNDARERRHSLSGKIRDELGNSKPHKGNDAAWAAIRAVKQRDGGIGLRDFKLLLGLGSGDIGTVFLSELRGSKTYFAMKVMDKISLAKRNKLPRAQTEKEILESLDHPFLPTLYAHFETNQFSCLVMDFCPGGDLYNLRQLQYGKRFDEEAARFYAAEVLLALEYLHMMGVVYRDLKPENVLVREDGHIMLSDFDLSLICDVSPTLIQSASTLLKVSRRCRGSFILPSCIAPCALEPLLYCASVGTSKPHTRWKKKKQRESCEVDNRIAPLPELFAEPTNARSMSFVGTHEYLAPEVVSGGGHGSAVDWWTLGVFLFELLFGKTPFKGSENEVTLMNVLAKPLSFPAGVDVSDSAKGLIASLLVKDPHIRLGSARGASEIKQHGFFREINWALIRCTLPPEIPRPFNLEQQLSITGTDPTSQRNHDPTAKSTDFEHY
ncbi:hypothetical protein O6H91_07G083500 [Diphasiastrum complanatum]|uniref:Uncharacterized protein n=1 Tax=Diphasiastrum complanatum TaxID=34168 RepID=A0ACC2D760_DIPCM|nr:hypothetical protein O6H91_07G083500 [Diphasiastrum complanatum]